MLLHNSIATSISTRPRLTASVVGNRQGMRAVPCSAVKLYGHPGTRSPLVDWYLHEISCPFESKLPNEPGNPHPFGQVPALSDDGGVEIFESGAILLYLADKYGGLDTPEARAGVTKWIVWANASLDPILFKENEQGKVIGTGAVGDPKGLQRLEAILAKSDYVTGSEFTVADISIAAYLLYVPQFFAKVDMGKWPNISAYMARCAARPAYEKAFGAQTTSYVRDMCKKYIASAGSSGSGKFQLPKLF